MVQFAAPPKPSPITPIIVPRELITKPFFPAKSRPHPQIFEFSDAKWTIGAPRIDRRGRMADFDIRHGRLCFALMAFRDRANTAHEIHFSFNELAHTYARSNGGRYSQHLIDLLYDLVDTEIRIDYADGSFDQFPIVNKPYICGVNFARRRDAFAALNGQHEMRFNHVKLAPKFFGLMQNYQNLARIRLDVLTAMRSPIAQAIYAFLPSRAVHRGESNPFEIRLDTLMEQIGLTVPKQKSARFQRFTQNKTPVVEELNGAATTSGTLRVRLAETTDGSDYKLCAWVETPTEHPPQPVTGQSALLDAWLAGGNTRSEFNRRIKEAYPLDPYLIDLIARTGAQHATNERFFFMIAALIGRRRFEIILSETKSDALEGNPGNNPTGRLIWRLMKSLRDRA